MKIEMTKGLKFSPNCRTVLSLEKADIIEVGDNGRTKDNLSRLVELEVARKIGVADIPVAEEPEVVVDFRDITNKAELKKFAFENHGVELDTGKSREKMIVILEDAIENEGE